MLDLGATQRGSVLREVIRQNMTIFNLTLEVMYYSSRLVGIG